ncbi:Na-Ca exchanger/integrin-beta4 [Calothrix sp. NIES-2100]|uniref:hypothetical protein n=1 Tax=Calothrix sp. NIES-2100 TaxID=1954172 RepID=UPI000B5EF73B|nr:Na-Ca exchanger/integrin-beta4 [Calothrix sp. NIES-2100]
MTNNISHLSPTEANTLLNNSAVLPQFVKDCFINQSNIELQLGNKFLNLKFLGKIEIQEMLNAYLLNLGLSRNKPKLQTFKVWNPSINIQVVANRQQSYQVIIPQLNSRYIISLLSDLPGITLPETLKLQLESLDNVGLVLSNSGIYLNFANDLQLNLDDIFSIHSPVPFIEQAFDSIIAGIFGNSQLIISAPTFGIIKSIKGFDFSFTGLLNSQNIEVIFGKENTLKYQLNRAIDFSDLTNSIPIIKDLKLIKPEIIITNTGYPFDHPKLGQINLSRGFNFIGDVNFNNLDTNFSNFINSKLETSYLRVLISFDPGGQVSLTGHIPQNMQLFSVEQFNATFNNLLLGLNIGSDLEPNFGLTGNLILQGYDPTQKDEPTLFLSGNLSLEPESLTAFFYQKSEKSWSNPYGLVGTEFRNVGFQLGGTYLPPYFDNFGFIGDLRWEKIDLKVAFLIDTNDPEKLALVLNTNQVVNLVDLWRGPVSAFILNQANFHPDLVNKALGFLENFVDLNIESIDRDKDGELNPLIKYVPFPTTIAGNPIAEGLEINGKITAWERDATLSLQGDKTFSNIEGLLKVSEIDLGLVKIGGTDDDTLDLALKVTPTEQYFMGDGYVEILDNEIVNVEFKITPTNAIFKNFDLNLANLLSIDVDALSIDLKSGSGSGSGKILVLGNTLAGITFDVTKNSVALKNTKFNLAGFLTVDIPILMVNLTNQSAEGTANITAFNQSLGSGTLSFNTQQVTINNSSLGLGDILKLNVPSFKLDLTNKKLFGLGDVTFLGKQFTSLGISLNETGFQASSNFNFGILAFNGATVSFNPGTNGNISNSASIAGNLKFLGYEFANIIASVNSSKLIVSGSFNFGGVLILKGARNQKNATITLKKAKNGLYNSVQISGSFYLLGKKLTHVTSSNNEALKNLGIIVKRKSVKDVKE